PELPLEVVEQRPHVHAADVDTAVDRRRDRLDALLQVPDAAGVVDTACRVDVVVQGRTDLGDEHRNVRVLAAHAGEAFVQPPRDGSDTCAHHRPRWVDQL